MLINHPASPPSHLMTFKLLTNDHIIQKFELQWIQPKATCIYYSPGIHRMLKILMSAYLAASHLAIFLLRPTPSNNWPSTSTHTVQHLLWASPVSDNVSYFKPRQHNKTVRLILRFFLLH